MSFLLHNQIARDPALALDLPGTTGRYLDTVATQPAAVAEPVAAWKDLGAGIAVTQATQLSRPTAMVTGLSFDCGDWLETPDRAELKFNGNSRSVAVWFRLAATTGQQALLAKDTVGGREVLLFSNGTSLLWYANGVAVGPSIAGLTANTWHFAVGVLDAAAKAVRLSLNGAAFVSSTYTTAAAPTTAALTLGRSLYTGSERYLNGQLGSVRIWASLLDSAAVAALWAAERGGYGV